MATEQRLIDPNALESKMCGLCDEFGTDHLFIDAIVYEIGTAPTVDAVEVVRCKDCIHCDKYMNWNNRYYYGCDWTHDIHEVEPEHFCSYGERKTDVQVAY